jgi:Predicted transcriptional regulator
MNNSLNDRFNLIIDSLMKSNQSLKKNEISQRIGLKKNAFSEILSGRTKVGVETVQKICIEYGVNPDYLLFETGDMFRHIAGEQENQVFPLRTDRLIACQSIPIFDVRASMGLVPLFTNKLDTIPTGYIELPNSPKCDGAIYAFGDSMTPLFKAGDIVAYKMIIDIESNIIYGEIYLLSIDMEGEEYITIKYVHRSEKKGYILLASENMEHTATDIPISRIRALALVKASVRYHSIH